MADAPTPGEPVYRIPPIHEILEKSVRWDLLAEQRDWGHNNLGLQELHNAGHKGEGVLIAVCDTGVDPDHPDLRDELDVGKCFNFTTDRSWDDGHGHGCVAPTDKVFTSLCGLQDIEYLFDNAPGIVHEFPERRAVIKDVSRYGVYTVSADPKTGEPMRAKVLAVHRLRHTGPVFKVTTRQGELTLTPWHPVYVIVSSTGKRKRVAKRRADELKVGDKVLLAGAGPDVGQTVTMPYRRRWKCVHCGYESRGGKRPQCKGCNRWHWHEGPSHDAKPIDEDLAYWLGLVASDGHLLNRQRSIDFTSGDERIGAQFSSLCVQLFGAEPRRYQYGKRAATWRLNCDDAHRLAADCGIPVGDKSRTVRVPNLITKSPRAVICAFVAGLLEGDGNVRSRIRLASGSREFCDDLVSLLRTIGVRSSVSTLKPWRSRHESYSVAIGGDPEICSKLRVKDGGVVSRAKGRDGAAITGIATEDYDGLMYDLTVEGTTTYVANGHIVSNTHCLGIAAASQGKDIGIVGAAPLARKCAMKVLSNSGSGASSWIAAGIRKAADVGADIISLSLGGPSPDPQTRAAIQYAIGKGCWVVCAAGNDGGPAASYPGHYPESVAVCATDHANRRASFSTINPGNDVSAPGVSILSTLPGNRYGTMSGTSMATPYVAGCLALVRGAVRKAGMPMPTQSQVLAAIQDTSTDLSPSGHDAQTGWGLINTAGLIARFAAAPPPAPEPTPPGPGPQPQPPAPPPGFTGTLIYEGGVLKKLASSHDARMMAHAAPNDILDVIRDNLRVALPIVVAGLLAGKSWQQILAEVLAAIAAQKP